MVKVRGAKTPLSVKVEFLEWFMSRDPAKGSQSAWAKTHDLAPETVSRWVHEDAEFDLLLTAAEKAQGKRRAAVIEAMYDVATNPNDMQCVQAATFLAKVFGWYAPEKHQVDVTERVAYTAPDALQKMGEQVLAQARPN